MTELSDDLSTGIRLHKAGRLADAEQLYRQVLNRDPYRVQAWHYLGLIALASKQYEAAIHLIGQAIRLNPTYADAQCDLGNCYKDQRRFDEAVACYEGALAIKPSLGTAYHNLGSIRREQLRLEEAVALYRKAIEINPGSRMSYFGLGRTLQALGQYEDAAAQFSLALALKADWPEADVDLGNCLVKLGRVDEALSCFQQALQLRPGYADAYHNLGVALHTAGRFEEALVTYREALRHHPNSVESYVGLGAAFLLLGKVDEAYSAYQQAIRLNPACAEAYSHLGNTLKDLGRLEEAIAAYKRASELNPADAAVYSNLLYSLYFTPGWSGVAIREEHQAWNERFARPWAAIHEPHGNAKDANRRLRIGYVSPDFRQHCQSFFTTPLLSSHDREAFEIFCYSDVLHPDEITSRLQGYVHHWRPITGLPDAAVGDMIRQDEIDILVDLTMHMERNRLLLFACKPAPVQVAWLAYPGTTGVAATGYRLTDPHLDPPGQHDEHYTERSVRLADSFWCYDSLGMAPEVSDLPAATNGFITFGSLNNFCKVNEDVLKLWGRVLAAVDSSQLMLLTPEGSARTRVVQAFAEAGVDAERIRFVGRQPIQQYLALYQQVDIVLDTFPYNGHTTSLDALYMGVPVVTILGETAVGRGGFSQLTNLGLAELVARTEGEFVAIAGQLAKDRTRLAELRGSLRGRMQRSPLMDGERFARSVEAAYREMWGRWCAGGADN